MSKKTEVDPWGTAQLAHIGWGGFLVLILAPLSMGWALTLTAVIAFVKEALEATGHAPWEVKQSWRNSLEDFAFFCVGASLAVIIRVTLI